MEMCLYLIMKGQTHQLILGVLDLQGIGTAVGAAQDRVASRILRMIMVGIPLKKTRMHNVSHSNVDRILAFLVNQFQTSVFWFLILVFHRATPI